MHVLVSQFVRLFLPLTCLLLLAGATPPADTAARIQDLLIKGDTANFEMRDLDLAALRDFYGSRSYQTAWTAGETPTRDAEIALTALEHTGEDGLDAAQYHVNEILIRQRAATAEGRAEFELLLTDGLLRFARDLRSGRSQLRALDRDVDLPAERFNAPSALNDALSSGRLSGFLQTLAPPHPPYDRLKQALARYRHIVDAGGWQPILGPIPDSLDAQSPQTDNLAKRLALEDEGLTADPARDLKAALEEFQQHHGLEADGRPGPKTMEALNVPASARSDAIEANMERWRWLPRDLGRRYILVNAADATLDVVDSGRVVLRSKVIVGKPSTRTAIFTANITAVTINPDWKIPASIARKEILPKARRNPNYLNKNHIVIGPSGTLRQLPGPDNSLGQIKLEMPNRFDEYLHDTPARTLFARTERHLSHGCMRVEQIQPLASFAMTGDPEKGVPDIQADIAEGANKRISLDAVLPVFVVYWTVIANEDGSVDFVRDVYGRDQRLLASLAGKRLVGRVTMNTASECSKT